MQPFTGSSSKWVFKKDIRGEWSISLRELGVKEDGEFISPVDGKTVKLSEMLRISYDRGLSNYWSLEMGEVRLHIDNPSYLTERQRAEEAQRRAAVKPLTLTDLMR